MRVAEERRSGSGRAPPSPSPSAAASSHTYGALDIVAARLVSTRRLDRRHLGQHRRRKWMLARSRLTDDRRRSIDSIAPQVSGSWTRCRAAPHARRSSSIYQSTPVWSPDSSAFVVRWRREAGPPNLYLRAARRPRASAEHLSGTAAQTLFPQSWSPDGRYLALREHGPEDRRRYLASSRSTTASRKRIQIPADVNSRKRTRASRRTVVGWPTCRMSRDGPACMWRRFPQPGRAWLVSANGKLVPVWQQSGRELSCPRPGQTLDGGTRRLPDRDFIARSADPAVPTARGDRQPGVRHLLRHTAPDGRFPRSTYLVEHISRRRSTPVVLNWSADIPPR